MKVDGFTKSYGEIKLKVDDLNKEIKSYNIKTAIKIYAMFLSFFALGGSIGYGIQALLGAGTLATFAALGVVLPVIYYGSAFLAKKIDTKFLVPEFTKMLNKIIDFKKNHIDNKGYFVKTAIDYDSNLLSRGLIPFTLSKVKISSYEDSKDAYNNTSYFGWMKSIFA
ncbi:MAG: hypothetical protein JXA94_00795 [Parachlamydiales bacterium]|nr:hypothetical protein [Parachlamydiales bacterium]